MRMIRPIVYCCFAGLLTSLAWSETPFLDIAPFALRCCVKDQHTSQVAFDYHEARSVGQNAERTADGRYVYGLQWAEERDIREVRVRSGAAGNLPRGELQYWFRNWPYPPPRCPPSKIPLTIPGRDSG